MHGLRTKWQRSCTKPSEDGVSTCSCVLASYTSDLGEFFVVVTYRDTVAREPRCEIRCDSQARFRGEKHCRGKIRLPSDLRVKHEDEKVKPGVFKHVRIIASSKCTAIAWRGVLCVKKLQVCSCTNGQYDRSAFTTEAYLIHLLVLLLCCRGSFEPLSLPRIQLGPAYLH